MMAFEVSSAEAFCLLLAVSAGLSVVQGAYDTAPHNVVTSGSSRDAAVRSGLIRNQDPNSNNDFSQTVSGVSSSGADSSLKLLRGTGSAAASSNLGPSPSNSNNDFSRTVSGVSSSGADSSLVLLRGTGSTAASRNLGVSSLDSNFGFVGPIPGANVGLAFDLQNGPTDSSFRPSATAASADKQVQRIVNIPGSLGSGVRPVTVLETALNEDFLQEPVTITLETTVDVFKTIANIFYNSVPVTLTEFIKTTVLLPTLQVVTTPVDDRVFVATAPVTLTQTVTVTNTNTGFLYATEVSTDVYTVTHKAYDIRQKSITSTIHQTQVFRPTIVRTRINTEYDTQTVEQTVINTIVIQPRSTLPQGINTRTLFRDEQFAGQGRQSFVDQQFAGQGRQSSVDQQFAGQGQQSTGQGQQSFDTQQFTGNEQQAFVDQQFANQFGRQQNLFARNPQASVGGTLFQQTSGQVSRSEQLAQEGQQLLNLQLPVQN